MVAIGKFETIPEHSQLSLSEYSSCDMIHTSIDRQTPFTMLALTTHSCRLPMLLVTLG